MGSVVQPFVVRRWARVPDRVLLLLPSGRPYASTDRTLAGE